MFQQKCRRVKLKHVSMLGEKKNKPDKEKS